MTLADITDAHVRALLGEGFSYEDWDAAADAGLVGRCIDPAVGVPSPTDEGDRYLAEAQRIADGLTDDDARHIAAYLDLTPLGTLVLALRERVLKNSLAQHGTEC